jgi:hypothetical protein
VPIRRVDSHDVTQHAQHRSPQDAAVSQYRRRNVSAAVAALGSGDDAHVVDDAEPPRQVGHGTSGVGEDVLDVGVRAKVLL